MHIHGDVSHDVEHKVLVITQCVIPDYTAQEYCTFCWLLNRVAGWETDNCLYLDGNRRCTYTGDVFHCKSNHASSFVDGSANWQGRCENSVVYWWCIAWQVCAFKYVNFTRRVEIRLVLEPHHKRRQEARRDGSHGLLRDKEVVSLDCLNDHFNVCHRAWILDLHLVESLVVEKLAIRVSHCMIVD